MHGFRARMSTRAGRAHLGRRRRGRKSVSRGTRNQHHQCSGTPSPVDLAFGGRREAGRGGTVVVYLYIGAFTGVAHGTRLEGRQRRDAPHAASTSCHHKRPAGPGTQRWNGACLVLRFAARRGRARRSWRPMCERTPATQRLSGSHTGAQSGAGIATLAPVWRPAWHRVWAGIAGHQPPETSAGRAD